jgi:hypothetical protein
MPTADSSLGKRNVTHGDSSVWGAGRFPKATDRGAQTRTQLQKLERGFYPFFICFSVY